MLINNTKEDEMELKGQTNGLIRTDLSLDERKTLRAQARQKGMTVKGYTDSILRRAIQEEAERERA